MQPYKEGQMMQEGYIKLHRCILDSSWSRHPDFVAVWVYCLLRANYNPADVVTKGGAVVHLEPGQFITSREQISAGTGVQESKVERILKLFKSEQQIEQQNKGKFRVITITNWFKYQAREQHNEQQMNNKRTTDEQQMNTNKKVKKEEEGKEEKKETGDVKFFLPTPEQVQTYMDEIGFRSDGEHFVDYYSAKGWMIGKNKMKDWKAAVRTWRKNSTPKQENNPQERPDYMRGVQI